VAVVVGRRVLEEDDLDLLLEPLVLPAEPVADLGRVAQRAPHGVDRRVDHDLDDDGIAHVSSLAGAGWPPTTTR
jgi:hypothetical protein